MGLTIIKVGTQLGKKYSDVVRSSQMKSLSIMDIEAYLLIMEHEDIITFKCLLKKY